MGSYTLRYLGKYEKIAHNWLQNYHVQFQTQNVLISVGLETGRWKYFLANNVSQNKIQIKKKVKSQIQG